MKNFIAKLRCLGLVLALVPVSAFGATYDWGGSVQVRGEVKNNLDFDDSSQDYTLIQSRLAGSVIFNSHWRVETELQDARIFGETIEGTPSINGNALNQTFADDLDIHRFAIQYRAENLDIRLGRQKLNLGDKRLVASLEWVNTARVHDGLRVDFSLDDLSLSAFVTELVSIDPNSLNDGADTASRYLNSQFNGVFIEQKHIVGIDVLEAWWLHRRNSSFEDNVHTFGFRVQKNLFGWHTQAQASLQRGDFSGDQHDATMAQASVSKAIADGVLSLSFAWASGDDDLDDERHKTFDNLYPLNHAYYGALDLVSLQNLRTIELKYQHNFWQGSLKLQAALHGFWLDNKNDFWYEAGVRPVARAFLDASRINQQERFLGSEFDVSIEYSLPNARLKDLKLLAGYSYFDSGQRVQDEVNESAADPNFLYLQMAINF